MTVKCKGYWGRNGLTGEGLLSKDRILGMQVGIWPDPVQEVFYIFCLFFFFSLLETILLKSDYIIANSGGIFSAAVYMGIHYL